MKKLKTYSFYDKKYIMDMPYYEIPAISKKDAIQKFVQAGGKWNKAKKNSYITWRG